LPIDFVYLASSSPRRQQLLQQIGIRFELLTADPHEDPEALEQRRAGEPPDRYVRRVVLQKLQAAIERRERRGLPAAAILAADTTVAKGGSILGKPASREEAIQMISRLAGTTHRVLTAVAVHRGQAARCVTQVSRVTFARLTARQIAEYVDSGESYDKAGGYGIQGRAAAFVRRIEGSYTGIMGLPLYETARLLR
jgi:septum formation protein